MKVLPFTMLVPDDKSVISEHINLPFFYQYLHRHDEWQLTWVKKGEGTLIAGNNMHSFRSGDLFLIGANLPHLFKSNPEYFTDEDKNIEACSLYFNPSGVLGGLFNLPEMNIISTFLRNNKHGFIIPSDYAAQITTKVSQVHEASGTDVLFNLVDLLNSLHSIKEQVVPLCSQLYSSDISETEGVRLSNILNYIMRNYNNQIALEDIANAAYMTPQAFCRYFKKHTGHTFVSFLNEVRINDACKSLIASSKTDCISGVAYKSGFNSITNFNRVFKNIIGQSPRAYVDAYNNVSKVNRLSA
ncbi:AraC family transcriptional regulator [Pedobacter antarcticus]|uniref:AraC family transcriptional regulator n=2 Tax=Pedobacter antarcticus TaxID=34086 RepID=A0A081PD99_9SPHI|nr:AraC family transcriptional regulator [Pedobacter antarcticus]KEQ28672.1 AraC family transcriptional regulator [Pedobacter antarcticus 4BY]SDL69842.1 transcriptional regulator, AraC family [Pedobacter antarcticus]SFE88496.1 AraC-type DNA-binding protein [Pedobacter antarcticus]